MINETSAGIVFFLSVSSENQFLLLNYPQKHWDFVKGKIEKNEEHEKLLEERQKKKLVLLILSS